MRALIITAVCVCLTVAAGADEKPNHDVPDLTKGGELTRINERWAGPIGILCGSWRPRMRQHEEEQPYVRQLLVMKVDKGSPADGILEVGDVILGADGTGADEVPLFESADWAMIPIADAITEAEARDPAILKLLRWRKGKTATVTIKLETLGRYSDTAPYNCEKSKRILREGIRALYEENKPDKAGFSILCLLAADDPTNPDNAKYQARAKEWAHNLEYIDSPWFSGPQLIALSEYYMKTKDEAIFPKLVKAAENHARGVSWFGTTGHKWADEQPDGSPGGRLSGYGPINASGVLGFLGLSLAREAGVKSPIVDAAIKHQSIFFGHFALHSGLGYGEMPYAIMGGRGDVNGKCAMSGLALGLEEGQEYKAKYFTLMSAISTYAVRQYAHGGSYFGQVWHPIGAAQGGVKTAHMQFEEIRWHLDLKRRWDHTRIYDSSGNNYGGFSYAATSLLFYAMPLKQLYITGRGQKDSLKLTDAEFDDLLAIKNFDAAKATNTELIAELSRHQGMTREAAADELANRIKKAPESGSSQALVDQLLALAADRKANASGRAGACATLMFLKSGDSGPVADLKNQEIAKTMVGLLEDSDPYIRFGCVRVLQELDTKAVRPHVNEILDAVIATGRPTFPLDEEDPCQWAHGEMGILLFGRVLNEGLDGVDRTKLIPAIRSLLKTPNGSARNTTARVLAMLTKEEVLQLADVIVDNDILPPPANAMGGTGAPNCQKVLTKYLFEEALPVSALYDNRNGSGVQMAIANKAPEKFGRAVLTMQSGHDFMVELGRLMMSRGLDTRPALKAIIENPAPEKLNQLKRIHSVKAAVPTLTLPAAATELVVDATNYALPDESQTTYTWRKVYGAGKVTFTPNGSEQSKKTTVAFTDKKPGEYRFEVAMSDSLGFTTVRQTIDVMLYDSRGTLPANQPPTATSQILTVAPGNPVPITLSGTDPDGDDIGFAVIKGPDHGRLTGVGGHVTYTAALGFNGTDQITFQAIDGQGKTATGAVTLNVSNKGVGVPVYEPFDGYAEGNIIGQQAKGIGLEGAWTTGNGGKFTVSPGSLSSSAFPSSGGKCISQRLKSASIAISPDALAKHKLLESGGELWFSVVLGKKIDVQSFSLHGGSADVGFAVSSQKVTATLNFRKVEGQMFSSRVNNMMAKGVVNQHQKLSGKGIDWLEEGPNLFIGHCIWGKTDEDEDTVEIYRVIELPGYGPMVINKPISVVKRHVAQSQINTLTLNSGTTWDEIRIGPTLPSVLLGTTPPEAVHN